VLVRCHTARHLDTFSSPSTELNGLAVLSCMQSNCHALTADDVLMSSVQKFGTACRTILETTPYLFIYLRATTNANYSHVTNFLGRHRTQKLCDSSRCINSYCHWRCYCHCYNSNRGSANRYRRGLAFELPNPLPPLKFLDTLLFYGGIDCSHDAVERISFSVMDSSAETRLKETKCVNFVSKFAKLT